MADDTNNEKLTIGFLVDSLTSDYQKQVFHGVCHEAQRRGARVIAFCGGILEDITVHGQGRNATFQLAGTQHCDALVVMAGAIGSRVGPHELAAFCSRFAPLPICAVGVALPGYPSIVVDNATGTQAAMDHLIRRCGKKRVAFIRGPEGNLEAESRFEIFQEYLRNSGSAFDLDLVTAGDFEEISGERAITTLLDDRRVGFDAVFAASDLMAIGATRALLARHVPVPEKVAVIGFDDITEAASAPSPLTTVRQPLFEQGKAAAQILLEQLATGRVEATQTIQLPTELVVRESCGYMQLRQQGQETEYEVTSPFGTFDNAYAHLRRELASALIESAGFHAIGLDHGWAERYLFLFVSGFKGKNPGLLQSTSFIPWLENQLRRVADNGGLVSAWYHVVERSRELLLPHLSTHAHWRAQAEKQWQKATRIVGTVAERHEVRTRLNYQAFARNLSHANGEILHAKQLSDLAKIIDQFAANLELNWLQVFWGASGSPEIKRVLSLTNGRTTALEEAFTSSSPDASPASLRLTPLTTSNTPFASVVEVLWLDKEPIGFIQSEYRAAAGLSWETLRDALSVTLYRFHASTLNEI